MAQWLLKNWALLVWGWAIAMLLFLMVWSRFRDEVKQGENRD